MRSRRGSGGTLLILERGYGYSRMLGMWRKSAERQVTCSLPNPDTVPCTSLPQAVAILAAPFIGERYQMSAASSTYAKVSEFLLRPRPYMVELQQLDRAFNTSSTSVSNCL